MIPCLSLHTAHASPMDTLPHAVPLSRNTLPSFPISSPAHICSWVQRVWNSLRPNWIISGSLIKRKQFLQISNTVLNVLQYHNYIQLCKHVIRFKKVIHFLLLISYKAKKITNKTTYTIPTNVYSVLVVVWVRYTLPFTIRQNAPILSPLSLIELFKPLTPMVSLSLE